MDAKKSSVSLRSLCEAAIMIALAQILGYIKLYRMPFGGSVTLCMLPIMIYAVRWGAKNGFLAAFVFSVLQFMLDGGFTISWLSIFGDYIFAYTALGVAGLFKGKKSGLFTGSIAAGLARFTVTWIVGATIWGEYMPDTFFNMTMTSPWFYSFLYNGSYIFLSLIACLAVEAIIYKPLKKYL